jgi:hypothetical protein
MLTMPMGLCVCMKGGGRLMRYAAQNPTSSGKNICELSSHDNICELPRLSRNNCERSSREIIFSSDATGILVNALRIGIFVSAYLEGL